LSSFDAGVTQSAAAAQVADADYELWLQPTSTAFP
jgi:hypothetical protein